MVSSSVKVALVPEPVFLYYFFDAEISEITLCNLLGRCSMRHHIEFPLLARRMPDCENGQLIKMTIDPGTMLQLRQWVTCIKEVEKRNGTNSDTTTDVDDNAAPLADHNRPIKSWSVS